MKRIFTLIAILFMAIDFYGQIPLRNSIVNQVSNGDTIQWKITSSTNSMYNTNNLKFVSPFLTICKTLTTDTSIALLHGRNTGVVASQYLNLNGTLGVKYKIGINSTSYLSPLAVISDNNNTTAATRYSFNFTDGSLNKNRSTYAQATDSSSFNLSFSPLGKLLFNIKSSTGLSLLNIDSLSICRFGSSISTTDLNSTPGSIVFANPSAYMQIINTTASGSTAGSVVWLCSDDGAAVVNGDLLGSIIFGGARSAAHANNGGARIKSYAKATFASNNASSDLRFATTSGVTTTDRLVIDENGIITQSYNTSVYDSLTMFREKSRLIPAATRAITVSEAGSGQILVDSAGVAMLIANVHWDADATTYIDAIQYIKATSSYITYSTSNTAGNYLSFYDGGSTITIKNNRSYTLNYTFK